MIYGNINSSKLTREDIVIYNTHPHLLFRIVVVISNRFLSQFDSKHTSFSVNPLVAIVPLLLPSSINQYANAIG